MVVILAIKYVTVFGKRHSETDRSNGDTFEEWMIPGGWRMRVHVDERSSSQLRPGTRMHRNRQAMCQIRQSCPERGCPETTEGGG